MARLGNALEIGEILGNVLIDINDLYNERSISIEDFSKIASTLYGCNENNRLLENLKKDYCIFLYGKMTQFDFDISYGDFNKINFIYKGCKYYDLHFNKGDIKFEIKGKEPSEEMRKAYRRNLDILDYLDIEKAVDKHFSKKEKTEEKL